MAKILLSSNKSIGAVNDEQCLKVELSSNSKLLTKNNISEKLDLLEEYNLERDNCTSLRLTFNIYPYCSNILYNMITEVVKDEGTDKCFCQNIIDRQNNDPKNYHKIKKYDDRKNFSSEEFNTKQAIRDTEYSHKELGNFVYHCGLNILNNHILRNNDFNYVNNVKSRSKGFNSIKDYLRDINGDTYKKEMFYVVPGDNKDEETKKVDVHIYNLDNILNLKDTFKKQVFNNNGWYGFKNVSLLDVPIKNISEADNGVSPRSYRLNKVLNNNKPCEMIDFYPDRSLYSFIPKYNKDRRRTESNWDYFLTYPFQNNFEKFNELNGNSYNAIKVIKKEITTANNGNLMLQFKTFINHNIKPGEYVKIYFSEKKGGDIYEFARSLKVSSIGDINDGNHDKKHYFSVNYNEVKDFLGDKNPNKCQFFIKKTDNQVKCDYYFRMFKKLRMADGSIPTSGIGKLAYAETLFGDRASELVYTDTIEVGNLKTNRGKGITELFLTLIKRNAGRKEWYHDEKTGDSAVEYSHCFGKVTSGLDLPVEEVDYNIHRLHNVKKQGIDHNWPKERQEYVRGINNYVSSLFDSKEFEMNRPSEAIPDILEDDITDANEIFYGDIVEYDPYTDTETVIENVYHRFNTEQRELCEKDTFFHFYFDEIASDDFEVSKPQKDTNFEVVENDLSKSIEGFYFPDNLMLEGYYYNPHFRIKVRPMDVIAHNAYGEYINADFGLIDPEKEIGFVKKNVESGKFDFVKSKKEGEYNAIKIHTPKKNGIAIGDKCLLFKKHNNDNVWGRVLDIQSEYEYDNYAIVSVKDPLVENGKVTELGDSILFGDYHLIIVPEDVPSYASLIPSSEMLFSWKDPGIYSTKNPVDNMNDATFSNGCIYLENSFRFFLRRQDPFGKFGLRYGDSIPRELNAFIPEGEPFDTSITEFVPENNNLICG